MSQARILRGNSAARVVTLRTISSFAPFVESSWHCRRKSYSQALRQARFPRRTKAATAVVVPAKYVIREARLKTPRRNVA